MPGTQSDGTAAPHSSRRPDHVDVLQETAETMQVLEEMRAIGFQVGTIIHYASRVVGKPYRSQRNHYDIDPLVSMADAARDAA